MRRILVPVEVAEGVDADRWIEVDEDDLALAFDPGQPRDQRGRWRKAPGGVEQVGVTPFRGRGKSDDQDYFNTPRYKGFERKLQAEADDLGLEMIGIERGRGVWAGGGEPTARVRLKGEHERVVELMDRMGAAYNQDAVISWRKDSDGDDRRYRSTVPVETTDSAIERAIADVNQAVPAEHQIQGATRGPDGVLEILDLGNQAAGTVEALADDLDLTFRYAQGRGELRFKGEDYSA